MRKAVFTGAVSPCDPRHCGFAERPHAHCACGMTMPSSAARCDLCAMEGLDPAIDASLAAEPEIDAWDGRSYPSRRRHRVGRADAELYEQLLLVVLGQHEPPHLRLGWSSPRFAPEPVAGTATAPQEMAAEIAHQLGGPAAGDLVSRPELTRPSSARRTTA